MPMSGAKSPRSFLPPIAGRADSGTNVLYAPFWGEFPPILQSDSWTCAVPFKERSFDHTPSESIANNYTPSVQQLKIKHLTRRKTEFPEIRRLRLYSSRRFQGSRDQRKGAEWCTYTESRPSSPEEQLMKISESREYISQAVATQVMQRYNHYMVSGIESRLVEPLNPSFRKKLFQKIPLRLRTNLHLRRVADGIFAEIEADYYCAVKKSIVDYILLDPNERLRLMVPVILRGHCCSTVRAPVPWQTSVRATRDFCRQYLFISNPILVTLHSIWNSRFSNLTFLDVDDLKMGIPYGAGCLAGCVEKHCQKARDVFVNDWLPAAADVFAIQKDDWAYMVPIHGDCAEQADRFFVSVAAFMSCKVRAAVASSLTAFLNYVNTFNSGNSYETENDLKDFIHSPLLKIELVAENNDIVFRPSLTEAKRELLECICLIIAGNEHLPRVEKVMFPEMKDLLIYILSLHKDEELVSSCMATFSAVFDANKAGPLLYICKYFKYLHLISSESELEIEKLLSQGASLTKLRQKLQWLESISGEISLIPSYVSFNLIHLSATRLHEQLCQRVKVLQNLIVEHFVVKNRNVNQRLCGCFEEMCARAGETPTTTAELVELSDYLRNCKNLIAYELKEDIDIMAKNLLFLIDYATLSAEDVVLNNRVFNWPHNIRTMIEMSKARIDMRQDQIEADLRKRLVHFDTRLLACSKELEALQKRDPTVLNLDEIKTSLQILQRLTTLLDESKKELASINEEERLLGDEPSKFPILQTMLAVKEPYEKLWTTALAFTEKYEIWFGGPFKDLDADLITEEVDATWRTLYKLTKAFADQPGPKRVAENIKVRVERFRQQLPVLQMICNAGMRERHWEKVGEVVGHPIVPSEDSSLADMIDAGLPQYVQKMEEISVIASKEHSLEQSLNKMKSEWKDVHFHLVPYRETGVSILTAVDDIQLMMDDHILRVQTIRSSPYIKPLETDVKDWEEKLILMQDILDSWLKCQATWMYLEPIFGSEDIVKQMPVESRKFLRVDQTWREIVAGAMNDTRALIATSIPYMLQKLEENNRLLEEIQKGLNDYLDKKRLFFPRFFFLSNDELLEILSETKDPTRVQPHLKKCFEGIHRLQFGDEQEILAMVSLHNETVPFSQTIYPMASKGLVEKWLAQVEAAMVASLADIMSKAIEGLREKPLSEWVLQWPGQVVIGTQCIRWTAEVAAAIRNCSLGLETLQNWGQDFVAHSTANLDQIVQLLHHPLDPGKRITLGALIVISVHARDVVNQLMEEGVRDVSDFAWVSQLRYYCETAHEQKKISVTVRMVNTQMFYGFEYLGNSSRLVITPLTDRCYRTLLGALKLHLGGAPEGPAGTGKTETVKDLAKAMAKQCIVFNCSEGVDYQAMGKFFKGLAQAGAWACFDEFDRIDIEVLSVISQQIQSIQLAKSQNQTRFVFEGTELSLNASCAVFITMNPGYSGRQELPNNLKASFRTVSMIVPDYGIIGEISLYSCGFVEARALASKIVYVYRLCSEQLSPQPHYDYGMRTIKAVLLTASNLKLRHPQEPEAVLVLKALRNVNCPKFLAEDVVLFEGIVSDLFSDVELQPSDHSTLKKTLTVVLQDWKLQVVPAFVEKVLQIYDTMLVRHGVMLVGEPLSGKTTAYRVLAETLSRLEDIGESRVTYRAINPKALTLGQLYGSFDPASCEWKDGVLARTFREFATDGGGEGRKWIVFDGPVDTVWVENMNTVLDDNRKLCLMNGEIIQMQEEMILVFECADLDHASPATVSRCGMIYMAPRHLGWRPLKDSYLDTLPASIEKVQRRMISDMFEWLLPPTLDYVQRECQSFVPVNEMHSVASTIRFYDLLLEALRNPNGVEEGGLALQSQQVTNWLQALLLFAMVWGIAGTLIQQSRSSFDAFFRDLIYGQNELHMRPTTFRLSRLQMFPEKKLVFDYAFECKGNGQWVLWMDTIGKDQYKLPSVLGLEMIVPTNETARHTYFLSCCLSKKIPLLLVGPSGTGKTFITNAYLSSLPKKEFVINSVGFSARTTADHTQDMVMSRLDRRRKGVYGPPLGRKCVVFIDNLHLPTREQSGCQPPIELLRQWMDHGHWYDKKDASFLELVDTMLVSAMNPVARNEVSPRFLRHFHILSVDSLDDRSLVKIFTSVMEWHFGHGYEPSILQMAKVAIQATLSVYKAVTSRLLPTPSKSHYVFNLHDFSRVIRGMFLAPSTHLLTADKFVRLWIHEVYRVFHDRLVDYEDRSVLFEIVKVTCLRDFRQDLDILLAPICQGETVNETHLSNLFFSDCVETEGDRRVYDEVTNLDAMMESIEGYLKEYNAISPSPLMFVPFRYALEHVSRICRVLLQPRGHILLFGIDGSGRRTATRMAAFIANMELYQVEMSKNYTLGDWREDVKRIMRRVGIEGRPVVFLFSDDQVKDEAFLDELNTILTSGDIPNLYTSEEKAEILEKMQAVARELGEKVDSSPSSLYDYYVSRIQNNLHIVFTMSPTNSSFRTRLRMFPALIGCCTIDWFSDWPQEALEMVARKLIGDEDLDSTTVARCVTVSRLFHESVTKLSARYFAVWSRRTYVTPTSFLELILTFKQLLARKRTEIQTMRNRYVAGVEKLNFAAAQVTIMQDELTAERPKLIATTEETERLMIKIERDTIEVEAKKEVVAADEALANTAAAEAQAIKDECENDLAEATPAMESAIAALNTLKPQDITVIKSMKNPPAGIKLVMEAICIMKGLSPERKPDLGGSGKMIEDYWGPSQKLLGDLKFLDSLKAYDKDNIPPNVMKVIRNKYVCNPEFDPYVIRSVSMACEGLCRWICSIEVYNRVAKIVAPKKEKLRKAASDLGRQMEKLNAKRNQLQEVTDKLQIFNDEFIKKTKEKKDLEDRIDLCCKKLDRAEKLIGGLGGEKQRWSTLASELATQYGNVVGDVLLASGFVVYLGVFTAELRHQCLDEWLQICQQHFLPCSCPFSLVSTLGNPVQIREWNIAGLPVDSFSADNALIVSHSRRWPLMIDPQGQANKWIKRMEMSRQLEVIKMSDPNYMRTLEHCIQLGIPVLLEDVGQELDPALQPLLARQTFKQGLVECIRLSDTIVEYHSDFFLYITTRLQNPHYMPEISVKVTLLNFMITPIGLEDQLLGLVVAKEKPDLEEQKNELIVESASNRRQLQEIEDKILEVLSTSEGNILEDETAISVLSSSKALSEQIKTKQEATARTEQAIDETRNLYRCVATNASTLFFCISELAHIEPMYQYSLDWFIVQYVQSISSCPKSSELKQRMVKINELFTVNIYRNVCCSLFEKDRLVFSCILCLAILRSKGQMDETIWKFILTGGLALDNPHPNPAPTWLTDKSWNEIVCASMSLPKLKGLMKHVAEHCKEWKKVYDSKTPHSVDFPHPWNYLAGLERVAVIRCLRMDQLVKSIKELISTNLGPAYLEPPVFDLAESYADSNSCTPLIFVLSPGADPMDELLRYGLDQGYPRDQIQTLSLGQDQGPLAQQLIESAVENGSWVVLQNCHLVTRWLPTLEKICQEIIITQTTHRSFRLWLTSYPCPEFPISVLQNGIKMTIEPPRGLRANLLRSYLSSPICDPSFYSSCGHKQKLWQRLLYGLCFFHGVAQERKNFGSLGWNVPYEFCDSDLRISILQLQMLLNESRDELPLKALIYLTGELNYGGRVTDENDRRLMLSLLSNFYCADAASSWSYPLSVDNAFRLPSTCDYESVIEFIRGLQSTTPPSVFGLHENASIVQDKRETSQLLAGLLKLRPHQSSIWQPSMVNSILELAEDILNKLSSESLNCKAVREKYPVTYESCTNTVLQQEVVSFSRLHDTIVASLVNLQKAVRGQIVMTTELEEVFESLLEGNVPSLWSAVSYPSLKPLAGYVIDFLVRLKFIHSWIDGGIPSIVWISALFFPQTFITGVMQDYARKHGIPIDSLTLDCEIVNEEQSLSNGPVDGAYVRGLYLEGARWDRSGMKLSESLPRVLYDALPPIWLKPCVRKDGKASITSMLYSYQCPVYKTSLRRSEPSMTGRSTNFVFSIDLPSDQDPKHWTNRGVACLCQLDD